jgi:hypothetical protein
VDGEGVNWSRRQRRVVIKDQVIDDPVSGLIIQFRAVPRGESRLHITLPDGHMFAGHVRDFQFDKHGNLIGRGMVTTEPSGPKVKE